ncbi:hypothetical protein FRC01_014708 [Tulasnella sp. 417]|nr:hypothetical protein FRC01_014708 [Tulasnella sp. 417]
MEETAQAVAVKSPSSLPPVLCISELLFLIFKKLSISDCARVALVCRTWLDPALDLIWEDLSEPHPLLRLLGPINSSATKWDFDCGFPQADWARFRSYSQRVRSISYESQFDQESDSDMEHISPDLPIKLLYYVAMNQGSYLLPRVQAIRWVAMEDGELQLLIPFISPTLREIDIDVSGCGSISQAPSRLLRTLRYILPPDIRIFTFDSDVDAPLEEDVSAVIRQQGSLQTLNLPACALEPGMFKSGLQVLEGHCTVDSGLPPKELLGALAEACPHLKDVRLIFTSECNLTFDSISPLLRCSKLITVDLEYSGRWNLEEVDIKAMGDAWPRVEALNLCCRRGYRGLEPSHGMSMGMLPLFARYFSPTLRKLAVFLDSTNVPHPPYEETPFPNLEFFAVGNSPLNSEMAVSEVTAYLDSVLPARVDRIRSDRFPMHSDSSFQQFTPRFNRGTAWDTVGELLSKRRQESRGGTSK